MALKPGKYNPLLPDIELLDFSTKKRFGLKLEGSGALQIGTISQDDTVHVRQAGKRVGDFDEQRSWKGGRGIDRLSDRPDGYWDSKDAWTLSEGRAHPTLLWRFAKGLRSADFFLPDSTHSMGWKTLTGAAPYVAMSFTSSGFTTSYLRLWIRKHGTPGDLTISLYDDSSGSPGSSLDSVTLSASDVSDVLSKFQKFDFSNVLSSSTVYWIHIQCASTDNTNNHWDIGGYNDGSTGKSSTDGSTWAVANFDLYYYVANEDVARTFFTFFLDEAMYVVDAKEDLSTASQLYLNGDRGKATSATSTTLVQSTKSWVADRWIGAFVKIIRGTGAGQVREILDNDGTSLTVSAWLLTPDNTSEYIIYGTDWFTEITPAGLSLVSGNPVVVNRIVYFPQGAATLRTMVWNSTTAAHSFEDDSGAVKFLIKTTSASGIKLWGSNVSNLLYYASAVDYATSPTNLTWSGGQAIGDTTYPITGLAEKDGLIYIFKEDGVWWASDGLTTIAKLQGGLDKVPSADNGRGAIVHQQFLYHSWLHSVMRIYGSSHDDVGQDWSGWGLPDGREGVFSSFDSYTSLLIAGVDAGDGTSSVLGWDGLGWHELLRGYDAGLRIRMVKVQPCPETRNRLWIEIGGNLVYQELPYKKGSPRLDSGCRYMHEFVIESSAIDMGTASALAKFIKELTVYSKNLGGGSEIYVDFQVDDDVNTSTWTNATTVFESPESSAFLGLNNIRQFAYRLRVQVADNSLPVEILGVVPNGHARSPYKMVWTLRCKADMITAKGRLVRPDELMRWLLDNARVPGRIEMRSQYELAHKFWVIIHPPRMFPYRPAQNGKSEESVFTIVLEES